MREFLADFAYGLTRPWRELPLRSMTVDQLLGCIVQASFLSVLVLVYLAGAANPAPTGSPEPTVVRPATEAEIRQWQLDQLELAIDEARRADR
ncbi:hypothetical protein [Micromonospora sp. WMMD1082]|uniref:hypothetical protein n=1 Tax=Micromonospora sp. WMMD1082 TaxID=3016104 RepID=UPI002417B15D|nr:hypothetical protein [Micromonospora sp. WMMD1082]MDG4796174.1 hypothetical protein [Micromonospora sp. WMMD1082]